MSTKDTTFHFSSDAPLCLSVPPKESGFENVLVSNVDCQKSERTTKNGPCHNRLLQSIIDARTYVGHLSRNARYIERIMNMSIAVSTNRLQKGGTRIKYHYIRIFPLWRAEQRNKQRLYTIFMAHRIRIGHVFRSARRGVWYACAWPLLLAPQMRGCRKNMAVEGERDVVCHRRVTHCVWYIYCSHTLPLAWAGTRPHIAHGRLQHGNYVMINDKWLLGNSMRRSTTCV